MSETRPLESHSIVGAVLGKYRIVSKLSEGGMGAIYRAQHVILGKPAAVKILRPDLTTNDELLTRFVNEAKASSAIRHPGIIEVYDFGWTDDDRAYLAMEFLEGETLAARLQKRGQLSEVETARIIRGIASALTAAHDRGIFHRDLKPDNVFLVPDPDLPSGERPKVLDFGVAKLSDHATHTQTGTLMGTPMYMAPEQAQAAGAVDHRADLYSLGCICYELLVGEPPFMASGVGEIIAMHLFNAPAPPRSRVPTISPAFERIVMRLLDKDPAARFQSAAELSNALGAVFGARGVTTATPAAQAAIGATSNPQAVDPPRPTLADGAPPQRRNVLPFVAGIVTLAIVGGALFWLTRDTSERAAQQPPVREPPAPVEGAREPAPREVVQPTPAPGPVDPAAQSERTVENKPEPAPRPPGKGKRAKGNKTLPVTPEGSPMELTP